MFSVCAPFTFVLLAQSIWESVPVQVLSEEAMSCKYKFEVAVVLVAEILIANGPPVTVNVYQPSLLKVPMGQDVEVGVVAIFGASVRYYL